MNKLRTAVRPTVTLILTAATAFAAFYDKDAFQLLAGPTGLVIGWWFRTRDAERTG